MDTSISDTVSNLFGFGIVFAIVGVIFAIIILAAILQLFSIRKGTDAILDEIREWREEARKTNSSSQDGSAVNNVITDIEKSQNLPSEL